MEGQAQEWAGEGSGESEPLPRNFLKIRTWNSYFKNHFCLMHWRIKEFGQYGHRSQPNSAMSVFNSVISSPVGSGAKPQLPTNLAHFNTRRSYSKKVTRRSYWFFYPQKEIVITNELWGLFQPNFTRISHIWSGIWKFKKLFFQDGGQDGHQYSESNTSRLTIQI